jgi:hypothetical protein
MTVRFALPLLLILALPAGRADAQSARLDAVTREAVPGALGDASTLTPPAGPEELGLQVVLAGRLADGETRGLDLVGDVLYRSNGGYFEALDVTNPAASFLLGRHLAPQGIVQGADVQAGLAYVAVSRGTPFATRGSLEILDVSDPSSMTPVGQIPGRTVFDVRVVGTTAYLATGGGGLRLYDVSNPASPAAQGFLTVSGGSVLSVVPNGSVVYLAAGNAGFRIVDVSNPASPVALGSLPALGGFATRVAYEAGRAYVSVQDVGMVVVDVSNPAVPVELGRYLVTGPANFQIRSVAVSGTTAYVGKDDGIVSVDVTNPASPAALDSLIFGGSGASQYILLDGATAFVGNRYHGVRVLDIANPAALSEIDLIENGGFSFKVNVVDGVAYVADLLGQLRLIDVSNPFLPVELGRLGGLSNADGVDVSGNTAYLVHRGTFDPPTGMISRVDITNPAAPALIDQQTTPWWAYGVDVEGANVFVATGNNGTTDGSVRAYQDAGPLNLLDEGATGNQAFDVRIAAGRAYVPTFGSGLSILDVSNPADIQPISLNSIGAFSTSVEVDGTVAYMSDNDIGGSRGLSVIDVSNPSSPQLLDTGTTIAGGSPSDVALSTAWAPAMAFVSVDFVGLYPFMVGDPSNIEALPSIVTSDRATGVDAEGSTIVVADAGAGLWVFTIVPLPANEPGAPPAGLRLLDAGPNPFSSEARVRFELAASADVHVEAYSVLGRTVARMNLGTLPAGVAEVTLDGRGWPAGHYLVRIMAGGAAVSTRMTVAR